MTRSHLYHPVQDAAGDLVTNLSVRVLEPGTETPISETIYADRTTTTNILTSPFTAFSGVIDFYLDRPKVVRLGVTTPGGSETFFEDVPVGFPEYQYLSWSIAGNATIFTGKHRLYIERESTLLSARISADPAPSGNSIACDINLNGVSVFPSGGPVQALVLPDGENTATVDLGAIPLAIDDYLTFDIDQVGSTNPGANLVVQILLVRG